MQKHQRKNLALSLCNAALLALGLSFGFAAHAQVTTDSVITLQKAEGAQISKIDDWLIGVFEPNATTFTLTYKWDWTWVYTSTGLYSVEVNSSNGGSRLHLENNAGDVMNYSLYTYYRRAGGSYRIVGSTNTTVSYSNMSGSQTIDCSDERASNQQSNLWFAAVVSPTDFNAAPPGIYADFVTITVRPE